jgi:hypothetical protein
VSAPGRFRFRRRAGPGLVCGWAAVPCRRLARPGWCGAVRLEIDGSACRGRQTFLADDRHFQAARTNAGRHISRGPWRGSAYCRGLVGPVERWPAYRRYPVLDQTVQAEHGHLGAGRAAGRGRGDRAVVSPAAGALPADLGPFKWPGQPDLTGAAMLSRSGPTAGFRAVSARRAADLRFSGHHVDVGGTLAWSAGRPFHCQMSMVGDAVTGPEPPLTPPGGRS